jgi:hypothetical protein
MESPKLLQCKLEVMQHVALVTTFIGKFIGHLNKRCIYHDKSKLVDPEVEIFAEADKLKDITFGSDEYKQALADLGPALDHHYEVNDHHPQHFEKGIEDMDLMQLTEMFFDWWASTSRHEDGDIMKSIEINSERFGISPQLKRILENTVKRF